MRWLIMLVLVCTAAQTEEKFLYDYDENGYLAAVRAADRSASYAYGYEDGSLASVDDLLFGASFQRSYDGDGRLTAETLCGCLRTEYDYDAEGRRTRMTLPDGSYVIYGYENTFLSTISRFSPDGAHLYTHTFEEYDAQGRPSKEKLIGNAGIIRRSYDQQGRHTALSTPLGEEAVQAYHENGAASAIVRENRLVQYSYGDDGALVEEPGHTYAYDARGNRISKDGIPYVVDEEDRLVSAYRYDQDGNAATKGPLLLDYDAFGRLCRVESPEIFQVVYRYDGLHRRLIEERHTWNGSCWELEKALYFIYDNQYEVGAVDAAGRLLECRILGRRENGDAGSAVAIETPQGIFAPVYDLLGNTAGLISPQDGRAVQMYSYTAFGEEKIQEPALCPWRFASKRTDPLTGLVFFGRRYYDPRTGRWLTPDPAQKIDGPNLYTFVHNNPLLFSDLFGLESVLSQLTFWMGTTIQWYCYHVIPFPGVRNVGLRLGEWLGAEPIPDRHGSSRVGSVGQYDPASLHVNIWINGINSDLDFTIEIADRLSQACGGQKVYYIYNSTHGFMADLWEYLAGRLHFRTPAPRMIYQAVKEAVDEVGSEGTVTIFCHSHGAAILERAVKWLSDEEKQIVEIYTFGAVSLFKADGFAKVEHILSSRDYFPLYADPLSYLYAYFMNPSTVSFKLSETGSCLENHALLGPIYEKEILKICAELRQVEG